MIQIAERLRPFSHTPGIEFPLPFSQFSVVIYPAKLCFRSISEGNQFEVPLQILGPIEDFTAILDLERGGIHVSLKTSLGFVRYWLIYDKGLILYRKKAKEPLLKASSPEIREVDLYQFAEKESMERLSLGSSKQLLVEKVQDLQTLLPLWFRIGSMFEPSHLFSMEASELFNCYQTHFRGFLVPDLFRPALFGIEPIPGASPSILLSGVSSFIRSLFLHEKEGEIWVLPYLPPSLPAGRLTGWRLACGTMDLEWSKGKLRKMVLHATLDTKLKVHFHKKVENFRLMPEITLHSEGSLDLVAGTDYVFDHFLCS